MGKAMVAIHSVHHRYQLSVLGDVMINNINAINPWSDGHSNISVDSSCFCANLPTYTLFNADCNPFVA